jgi:ATP-dependent protease ClpP protease subunit
MKKIALCAAAIALLSTPALGKTVYYDKKSSVVLNSEVSAKTVKPILTLLQKPHKTIWIIINSPGGEVRAMETVLRNLDRRKYRGTTVNCIVSGKAQSAAFWLLSQCNNRYVLKRSILMYHDARFMSFFGSFDPTKLRTVWLDLTIANNVMHRDINKWLKLKPNVYRRYKDIDMRPEKLLQISPGSIIVIDDFRKE